MPKRRRRRRRGVEEVRALLAQARERGLSHREVAEEAGVQLNSVNRWIRRERERGEASRAETRADRETSLVPVRIVGPDVVSCESGRDSRIAVTLQGAFLSHDVHLDLASGVEPDDLRVLLGALAQHSC